MTETVIERGLWIELSKIEIYGITSDSLESGLTARLTLLGPGVAKFYGHRSLLARRSYPALEAP